MKCRKFEIAFVAFSLLLIFNSVLAYSASSLSGRVTDENGDALPFANVVVTAKIENGIEVPMRTQLGSTTDLEGYFIINNLSSGTYIVEAIYVGYKRASIQVEIGEDESANIDIQMEPQSVDLEEVVISIQARGQMGAINQQMASTAIKNVVASDRIQQNPDANATEALGRLPGVSVTRSGGEANDIVIRGLAPQYNTVTLNGIELPSNKSTSRNANLSGISQYSLQGVEVFKSITPDMNANTVSGAVNMKLRTAPDDFNTSIMVQSGYNAQNKDFGNYKVNAGLSNRFFDKKFGVDFNVSTERVNRSTQRLSSGINVETNFDIEGEYEPMRVTFIGLENVENYKYRNSGTLVLDYRFSPGSSIEFSNFFSYSPTESLNINKVYSPLAGSIRINVHDLVEDNQYLYSGALIGKQTLGIVKMDYGAAYSISKSNDERRDFGILNVEGYENSVIPQLRESLSLFELIELSSDELTDENLENFGMPGPGSDFISDQQEQQYEAHLDFTIPYNFLGFISGEIKTGGQVKYKDRYYNQDQRVYGGPPFHKLVSGIQTTGDGIEWALPWVKLNDRNHIYMEDMLGGTIGTFLQGDYDFGWYPEVSRLNEVYEWWQDITGYYRELYKDDLNALLTIFGQERMMGYYNPKVSAASDNETNETYYAGYLMAEMNIGNRLTFTPGFRYEKIENWLEGWWIESRLDEGLNIPGYKQDTTRENEFLLPMAHLKYKPFKWMYLQASYTQTLHRPNYNYIIPFEYINDALSPFQYDAGSPGLKPERWTNYDLVVAFHSNKLGLLAVNGFYKNVQDKIWRRTWKHLPGEVSPTRHFSDQQLFDVSSYYNNEEEVLVRGLELEWQTNFWYLPKPFSFFTLTANYSFIDNEASYPYSEVKTVQVDVVNGRPIYEKVRLDSSYSGPMLNQPKQLANVSLGFSYKSFDMWLSYQYIGEQWIGIGGQEETDLTKIAFARWGLQGRWGMPLKGLEMLFNVANLNDMQEKNFYKGDPRPQFIENYGWTSDLGFRYSF